MSRAFSESKTKYQILNNKDKNVYYDNSTDYMEFIFSLSNIMKNEPCYKFYIDNNKEYIMNKIMNANYIGIDFIKTEEQYIMNELQSLENFSKDDIDQLRYQYIYSKTKELDIPVFSSYRKITLEQLTELNYRFLKYFNNHYLIDTEKLIDDFSGNFLSLVFINSMINDYPEFFGVETTKICDVILDKNKGGYFSKNLNGIKSELEFTTYNTKTIRNLRKIKPHKIKKLSYNHK